MLDLLMQPITLETVREASRIQARNKIKRYYPDNGPLRRELYPKHIEFFAAGATHNERLAISGNRTGKSESLGGYETSVHLTGQYPEWWPGRRFDHPVDWWAAGKTAETTRDIPQFKLLGKLSRSKGESDGMVGLGTGMIPYDCILSTSPKSGLPDAVDTAEIRHVSGGVSRLGFKSYGKDRDSFEGTEKDGIWLDEEPPAEVNRECSIRLMSTKPGRRSGTKLITFTPLDGYTEVVNDFLESTDPDKWYIQIGWKDAPHLTASIIAEMSKKFLPYELKARSEGIPSAGEGVIYPIDPDEITVDDFRIPDYWPRAFGMDVGKTAVVWGALDRDNDILYLYREYYSEVYNALIHAAAIKGVGDRDKWIPGVIDPGSLGSSQVDGQKLFELYTKVHGLNLTLAENGVESGIYTVWERMITGRLKVFRSLTGWRSEFLQYRRRNVETKLGEHTQVVKKKDHRMDSCVVADTLIATTKGPVRIADLIGKVGYVYSRSGSVARFCGARKTLSDVPVVTVRFSNDSEVTCTPDHPFLTPDGWVQAIDLIGKSTYNGVSQCIHRQSFFLQPLKSFWGRAITYAESISSAVELGFTGSFGRPLMAGTSPRDTTSTMWITREPITLPIISNSRSRRSISATIPKEGAPISRQRPERPLRSGTVLRRGLHGTKSTILSMLTSFTRKGNSPVRNAGSYLSRTPRKPIDSAAATANTDGVWRLAWMTRNVIAWFAAQALWKISTSRNPHAHENALLSCVSVTEAGHRDVYCLTVPGPQAFCLSNGAVVHNTRYLTVSGIRIMKTRPISTEKKKPMGGLLGGFPQTGGSNFGWMGN